MSMPLGSKTRYSVKPVSLPSSPIDIQLKLMWRLLRLTFWLSAITTLVYTLANFQRGQLALALIDGVSLGAMVLGYRVSIRLARPETGIQAIAIIDWLTAGGDNHDARGAALARSCLDRSSLRRC